MINAAFGNGFASLKIFPSPKATHIKKNEEAYSEM
jgi:hypothetical protein